MDVSTEKQALNHAETSQMDAFMAEFRDTISKTFPQEVVTQMTFRKGSAFLWSGLFRFEVEFDDSAKAKGGVSGAFLGLLPRGNRMFGLGADKERNRKVLAIAMADITKNGGGIWSTLAHEAAEKANQ